MERGSGRVVEDGQVKGGSRDSGQRDGGVGWFAGMRSSLRSVSDDLGVDCGVKVRRVRYAGAKEAYIRARVKEISRGKALPSHSHSHPPRGTSISAL